MANFFRILVLLVTTSGIFISCGDLNRKANENIDRLMKKTESIDSLLNKEVDKALRLDSLINIGSEKAKKLDSIIDKSASRLDSLVNEKMNPNK